MVKAKNNLVPILMVNCFLWASLIVICLIILEDKQIQVQLFPVLAGGTTVSIVAVSIAWKTRNKR